MRKAVRFQIREGIDNIKLDVSGDPFYPSTPGNSTPMTFEEIKVAADTAHDLGRKINAHTRSAEGSKRCIRAGVDGLFHCEYSDGELLDLMEEAKDRIFVAPTVGLLHQMMAGDASPFGLTPEVAGYMGIADLLENSARTHTELRKRGIRHLIGGDYGFGWSQQGQQAADIGLFMKYYGYSAADALVCATRNGGLAMMDSGDLGTLEAGKLADLILVNGDVLADVSFLTEHGRIALVMKDGQVQRISPALRHSNPSPALEAAE
jgi:imidazolonepropionase-like amidohydrolase